MPRTCLGAVTEDMSTMSKTKSLLRAAAFLALAAAFAVAQAASAMAYPPGPT
jgi:hypothetical protein